MAFVPDEQPAGRFEPDSPSPQSGNPVTITTEKPGILERALPYMDPRGPFEAATSIATGIGGQVAGGLSGLAVGRVTGDYDKAADVSKRVSEALTYSPRSKSGEVLLKAAELPMVPIHAAADYVGERGAQVSPELGMIGKTSVEALPTLLGVRTGMAPKRGLTAAEERVAAARDAGYKLTPEEMGAGVVARTLGSVAGEPRLARALSKENTATATGKIKAELGIRPEAPLDLDTLAQIRKQEGTAYEAIRGAGEIPLDAQYIADIDALGAKYRSAAKDFPGLAKPEIEQVIQALKKEDPAVAAAEAQGIKLPESARVQASFDANSGVDLIGQLRESADKAFRTGDTGMAKVLRGGAEAIEKQIERHLERVGQPEVIQNFRAARERIAKTYAVEKALMGEEVNMQALGRQVQKRKPLTGALKEVGEYARDFERSSQKPSHMPTGATYADALMAMISGGGSALGNALTFGARPALRSILASKPAQYLMDPRTNLRVQEARGAASSQPQKETR